MGGMMPLSIFNRPQIFLFYKNRTFFTIQHQVPLDETPAGFMTIVKKRSIY